MNDRDVVIALAHAIYEKKGFDIIAFDVTGISTLTDYIIIAEGNVNKHVQAMARAVSDTAKKMKIKKVSIDGQNVGDWVVVDCCNVMVHLFAPGFRSIYQFDQLWRNASIIDVDIKLALNNEKHGDATL